MLALIEAQRTQAHEAGFCLWWWRERLAPEAARAAVAWGFERCGLARVVSFTLPENRRSQRVMEKLGMSFACEFERAGLPHLLYELHAS